MSESVRQQLESLPRLSKTKLVGLWQQLFKVAPSPKIRRPLLIRFLAYRMQEQAFGSINTAAETRLRRLGGALASTSNAKVSSIPQLRAGTRLVREWQNQIHLVNVEAKGYEYRGGRYKSLSEIARQITGTRWSGPLFFGVKSKAGHSTSQEVQ